MIHGFCTPVKMTLTVDRGRPACDIRRTMLIEMAAYARMRAYFNYREMSLRDIAAAAGISLKAVQRMRDTARFNPRPATWKRLSALVPPDFDPKAAVEEYRDGKARVRAWLKATGLKRYQLEPMGIQYEWVQHIAEPDWSPTWFMLRNLLKLVPADFDRHPSEREHHAARTPAKAKTGRKQSHL